MKFWKINDTDYYIYDYTSKISKEEIYHDIKEIFQRIQKKLKLKGYYHVIVTRKKIGVFMQIVLLENSFYKDVLDLKIEEDDTCEIYFCTEDYFQVCKSPSVLFLEDKYYVLVDDDFDYLPEQTEFGEFVFSSSMKNILTKLETHRKTHKGNWNPLTFFI